MLFTNLMTLKSLEDLLGLFFLAIMLHKRKMALELLVSFQTIFLLKMKIIDFTDIINNSCIAYYDECLI